MPPTRRFSVADAIIIGLLLIIGVFVIANFAMENVHHRQDEDAYVCGTADEQRFSCPDTFADGEDECPSLDWAPAAGFDNFTLCYFGLCAYFKVWEPMDPWPCFNVSGSWVSIELANKHCMDMLDDSTPYKDRLQATIFCFDDSFATCIYEDKCGEYELVEDSGEVPAPGPDPVIPPSDSVAPSSLFSSGHDHGKTSGGKGGRVKPFVFQRDQLGRRGNFSMPQYGSVKARFGPNPVTNGNSMRSKTPKSKPT